VTALALAACAALSAADADVARIRVGATPAGDAQPYRVAEDDEQVVHSGRAARHRWPARLCGVWDRDCRAARVRHDVMQTRTRTRTRTTSST
jgi:hypothetical protein